MNTTLNLAFGYITANIIVIGAVVTAAVRLA